MANSLTFNAATDHVLVERAGGVATLTLNKPDEHNRLTPDALARLETLAAEFAQDEETQAIVITGAGTTHFR